MLARPVHPIPAIFPSSAMSSAATRTRLVFSAVTTTTATTVTTTTVTTTVTSSTAMTHRAATRSTTRSHRTTPLVPSRGSTCSGAHLLDITRYNGTIEDNGDAHSDSTVLGLGGSRIIGSSASSKDHNREGDNGDALKLCSATSGVLCLSLLYHNAVATEDHDSSLAAARGGVAALCLGGHDKDTTASYECKGILSLGVAEGLGIAERDKEHGHTKADSANELLNLCLGKRDKLTTPCEGLGVEAVHADSKSRSEKPETERHSFLLGIDSNGKSTFLGDQDTSLGLPK